jgi:hypothetical protein
LGTDWGGAGWAVGTGWVVGTETVAEVGSPTKEVVAPVDMVSGGGQGARVGLLVLGQQLRGGVGYSVNLESQAGQDKHGVWFASRWKCSRHAVFERL